MAPEMDAEAAASPQSLSGVRKGSDTCARCASTPKVSSHEFFFLQSACIHGGYKKKKNDNILWCYHFVTAPEGRIHVPGKLHRKARQPHRSRRSEPLGMDGTLATRRCASTSGLGLDSWTWPRSPDAA